MPVCLAAGDQWYPWGAIDGSAGTIICWVDLGRGSIYAQRLDSSGTPLWATDGICLFDNASLLGTEVSLPAITPDGSGGAIIATSIGVGGINGVYAQRVTGNGSKLWGLSGVMISTLYATAEAQTQVFRDQQGVIVTWSSSGDIYAQKVNLSGTPQWGNGVKILDTDYALSSPSAVTDGAGGAIVAAIEETPAGGFRILSQRVDSAGSPLAGHLLNRMFL